MTCTFGCRKLPTAVVHIPPVEYRSIDDIATMHGATEPVLSQAAILHVVIAKSVLHDAPRLVIPVLGVIATEDAW